MSDPRENHVDSGMRYFTPDLYIRLNSDDGAEAERAVKEWDSALARYRQHIRRIRATMPTPVREVCALSLHDWELIQNPVELAQAIQSRPKTDLPFWLRFTAIGVRKAEDVIVLFYLLWDEVRVIAPVARWHRQRSPKGQSYWLYDEVDHVPSSVHQYVHRVLFSDGTVREIPFSSCYVYRFSSSDDARTERVSPRASARRKKTA